VYFILLERKKKSRISDRFFLGGIGPNSFRGFKLKGVGPRLRKDSYGGDIFFSSAIHLNHLLSDENKPYELYGHIFANYGGIEMWKDSPLATLQDLILNSRLSLGVGLIYKTPYFRVEANFSNPVFSLSTDKKEGLQLGITVEF